MISPQHSNREDKGTNTRPSTECKKKKKKKKNYTYIEILRFKVNTEATLQLKTLYLVSLVQTHLTFKQIMCWGRKEFIVEYQLQVKHWVGLTFLIYPH